ncbi:MAG: hypothetical protein ACXAC7_18690, partial [Candidatus Hodarchaeales archaeon]
MSELLSNLSTLEETSYHSLIAFGQLSLGEICYFNNIQLEQGIDSLNSLISKGLAAEIEGLKHRYIPRFPFFGASTELEETLVKVRAIKEKLSRFFKEKNEEIKTLQDAKEKEVVTKLSEQINDLETSKTAFDDEITQIVSDIKGDISAKDSQFNEELTSRNTQLIEAVQEKNTTAKSQSDEGVNQTQTHALNYLQEHKMAISEFNSNYLANNQTKVLTDIENAFTETKELISSLHQDLKDYKTAFDTESEAWINNSYNQSKTWGEENRQSLINVAEKAMKLVNSEKNSLSILDLSTDVDIKNTAISVPLQDIRGYLISLKKDLNQLKAKFDQDIEQQIQDHNESILTVLTNSKENLSSAIQQIHDKRGVLDSQFEEQLSSAVNQNKRATNDLVVELLAKHTQINSQNHTAINECITRTTQIHDQAEDAITTFTQSLDDPLRNDLKEQINSWKENYQTVLDNINHQTNTHFDGLDHSLGEYLSALNNLFDQLSNDIQSTVSEAGINHKAAFVEEMIQKKEMITEEFNKSKNFIQKGMEVLEGYKNEFIQQLIPSTEQAINSFEEITDKVNTTHREGSTNISDSYLQKMNEESDSVVNIINQIHENLTQSLLSTKENYESIQKTQIDEVIQTINSTEENLETTTKSQFTEINQSISATEDQFKTNLKTKIDEINQLNTNTKETFDITLKEKIAILKQEITSTQEKFGSSLNSQIADINNNFNKENQGFDKNLKNSLIEINNLEAKAKQNYEKLIKTTITEVDTEFVNTKQAFDKNVKTKLVVVGQEIPTTLGKAREKIQKTVQSTKLQFSNLENDLLTISDENLKSTKNYISTLENNVTTIQSGYLDSTQTNITNLETSLSKITDENLKSTKKNATQLENDLSEIIKTTTDSILTQLEIILTQDSIDDAKTQAEELKAIVANTRTNFENGLHSKISQINDGFNKVKQEFDKNLKTRLIEIKNDFAKVKQTNEKTIKTTIAELDNDFVDTKQGMDNSIKTKLASIGQEITNTLSDTREYFQKVIQSTKLQTTTLETNLIKISEDNLKAVKSLISTLELSLSKITDDHVKSNQKNLTSLETSLTKITGDNLKATEKNIAKLNNNFSQLSIATTNSKITHMTALEKDLLDIEVNNVESNKLNIIDLNNNLSGITQTTLTSTRTSTEALMNSLSEINQNTISSLRTGIDLLNKNLTGVTDETHQSHLDLSQSFADSSNKMIKDLRLKYTEELTAFKTSVLDFISETSKKRQETFKTWSTNVQAQFQAIIEKMEELEKLELLNEMVESLNSSSEIFHTGWTESTQSIIDKTLADIEEKMHVLEKTQQEKLVTQLTTLKETTLKNHQAETLTKINNQNDVFIQELEGLQERLETKITDFQGMVTSYKDTTLKNIPVEINQEMEKINQAITEFLTQIKDSISSLQENWEKESAELNSIITEQEQSNSTEQKNVLDNVQNQVNTEMQSWVEENTTLGKELIIKSKVTSEFIVDSSADAAITKTLTTLKDFYTNMLGIIEEDLTQILTLNEERFADKTVELQRLLDEIRDSKNNLLTTIKENTAGKIDGRDEKLTATLTNANKAFNEEHQAFSTQIISQTDQTFDKIETQVKIYYETIIQTLNTLSRDLGSAIEAYQQNMTEMTLTQMKNLLLALNEKIEIIQGIQIKLKESIQAFVEKEETVRESMVQGASNQFEIMLTGAKDYADEIQTHVSTSESVLDTRQVGLNDFDKIVKEYNYPEITSSPLIGWSSGITAIGTMLEEVKSSITLLIPDPANLEPLLEKLLATKKTRRVIIISQFDMGSAQEKKVMKQLLEKGNIALKRLEQGSFGAQQSGYPPFLSAYRDSEEIFFGSQDPENKSAFIGMVSTNSAYR